MTAQNFCAGTASDALLRLSGSGCYVYPNAGGSRELRRAAERAAKKAARRAAKEVRK